MELKNPQYNIWIIPLISFIINCLIKWTLIENPPAWLIFGIYLMGFVLIAYLANIYKKEKANEKAIEFLKEMVRTQEKTKEGSRVYGRIDENTIKVIKETLVNLK